MGRGRPVRSQIRQNIIELLFFLKEGYGYDIYRNYKEIFPPVSMRVIYYHLKKGAELGEFRVNKVVKENGNFSWGSETEKTYYSLGEEAKPIGAERVRNFISRKKENVREGSGSKSGNDEPIFHPS
ncbi:hypothetical protein KY358_02200 [Candidatus Woesearchaeota archaeon]|nr:hypothetical protein [Candidatus Woesearchaeota archaeon]